MTTASLPRHPAAAAQPNLYRLRPGEVWRYLKTQPPSFWLLCIYLFFEYIRPQQLRAYLNVFPWAQTALLLTLVAFLVEGGWFKVRSVASRWLLVFTAIVAVSIYTAAFQDIALKNLNVYFVWVLVYFLIVNILSTERRFFVFLLSYLIYHFYMSFGAVRQWVSIGFHFRSWGLAGGAGWFANSGDFGVALCIFLPLALYFALAEKPYVSKRKYYFIAAMPASALMAILGSSSRGAVVGVIAVGLWMLVRTKYRFKGLAAALVVLAIGFAILPAEQKARFSQAGDDATSVARLTYWKNGLTIAADHPLTGIGYYGWIPYNAAHFPRYRKIDGYLLAPELPHNLFVLAVAELGYPGLLALLVLMGLTFKINARTRKLAISDPTNGRFHMLIARGLDGSLVGLMVSGFFDTVLWYPFFWIQLALAVALHEVVRRKAAGLAPPRAAARRGAIRARRA